jgi:hypothetical protein
MGGNPMCRVEAASETVITPTTQGTRAAGIRVPAAPKQKAQAMDDEDPAIDTRPATNAWAGPLPLLIVFVAILAIALGTAILVVSGTTG